MILYYTRSQKTKVIATALHEVLGLPLHELQSDLNEKKNVRFLFNAIRMVLSYNGYPVTNMPDIITPEIYVCSPIWGGRLVGPARYFLDNADLSNTKVNIVLTASTPVEAYKARALESLSNISCIPGEGYIFATDKHLPEKDIVIDQLRELLPQ